MQQGRHLLALNRLRCDRALVLRLGSQPKSAAAAPVWELEHRLCMAASVCCHHSTLHSNVHADREGSTCLSFVRWEGTECLGFVCTHHRASEADDGSQEYEVRDPTLYLLALLDV